jgi:ParB family chromosome partitioning protein
VSNALFDVTSYQGSIVSDLFGEERYFADSEAFWTLQNVAIAERRIAYVEAEWSDVVILDIGDHFQTWNHQKTPKKQGGKVFVCVNATGEATFHEGWLTEKEARRRDKAEASGTGDGAARDGEASRPERPELTKPMRNYLGLHRHAVVRTELLARPEIALRLAAAHMIAGSGLWTVEAEKQKAENDAIAASLDASTAVAGFAGERSRMRALLGIDADEDGPVVCNTHGFRSGRSLASIFQRLLDLDDADVVRVLTFVMAETLEAHSAMVETLGTMFAIDMRCWWTPDAAFFDLMRDKEALTAMVREVAGDVTADAHVASTAKMQKKIVADCLKGEGRPKVEGWMPRYMAFPATGYTGRFVGLAPAEDEAQPDDAVEADGKIEAEGSDGEASDDDLPDAA